MQMDQVTQANASQTEEMSSTAQGLSANAEQLQALVAGFQLGSQSQTRQSAPAVLRPAAPARAARKPVSREPSLASLVRHTANEGKGEEEF